MKTNGFLSNTTIEGDIIDIAYQSDYTSTYRLRIDNIDNISTQDVSSILFIEVPKNLSIEINDILIFTGKILPTLTYPLTGFERYAWKEGIFGKVKITSFEKKNIGKKTFFSKAQKWSESVLFRGFPRDTAALLLGMTIGNTELLHSELKKDFLNSGMTHILVVSGSNIAFVILLIVFLLKYTGSNKWIRIGVVVLFVFLYSHLVGWEPPVIRATCMGILTYISLQYQTRISSIILLLSIGALYLSFSPNLLIYDAGFGLSFSATFGILFFHKKIQNYLNGIGLFSVLSDIISITIGAMLGSLPVMIFHFGTISIGGILANILIAPILGPLLFLSVGYMSLASLGVSELYYPGIFVYLPAEAVLMITSFFSEGVQLTIPEDYRISLGFTLLGFYSILLIFRELSLLIEKDQIMMKHQEVDPN
ncbi:ComEC/Rec2 family competence protein [Candidatus Gracilibacteria bacterium]|nr:ComEC/Rec2 family competence protein [Candidatus Gracilibacteria bacterium]